MVSISSDCWQGFLKGVFQTDAMLFQGLMDIPYHHVDVLQLGRPVRSSHAKTKKYSNRRNKERPAVNPEEKCVGYFLIEAQSLEVMKRLVSNLNTVDSG